MLYILNICCSRFILKLANTEMYLGGSDDEILTITDKLSADIFVLESAGHTEENYITSRSKNNKILSMEKGTKKINYSKKRTGKSNQIFSMIFTDSGYHKIMNPNELCVEFNEEREILTMSRCVNSNPNQQFEKINLDFPKDPSEKSNRNTINYDNVVSKEKYNRLVEIVTSCPISLQALRSNFMIF